MSYGAVCSDRGYFDLGGGVKVGSVALTMTGLDQRNVRFQAQSMFTNTGWTTRKAESLTVDRAGQIIDLLTQFGFTAERVGAETRGLRKNVKAIRRDDLSAGHDTSEVFKESKPMVNDIVTILSNQIAVLGKAAVSLPIAAVLSAALAFRPRRHGTPQRDLGVIHAQIILGVVGALVMLVIGESLARAFGIVGAAGLIRYRARIEDPKDAGVMLSTLGLGLASGVGLYLLAAFATLFLLLVLWLVESHTPKVQVPYRLRISTPEPMKLQPKIEAVLRSHHLPYELRSCSGDDLDYDVQIPSDQPTDEVSSALRDLETAGGESFTWELKKAV